MKISSFLPNDEKAVLIGMVMSDRVLGRIATHLKPHDKPFPSRWGNLLAHWCLQYYSTYQKSPKKQIIHLFNDYSQSASDESTVSLMEKFLTDLNSIYQKQSEEINEDFLLDVAVRCFTRTKLSRLCESVEADLDRNAIGEAQKKVEAFHPINFSTSGVIDVFTDKSAVRDALDSEESDVLVRYPKALGEFFGPHLQREGFIAFLAPEKRGKSAFLIDLAWRAAVLNRRRTLLYSVGDMSQRQMMRRILTRTLRRPLRAGKVKIPKRIRIEEGGRAGIQVEEKEWTEDVSSQEIKGELEKIKLRTASNSSLLKLRCTPNSSTRVADISSDLDELIRDNWIPDVVVIDYADILAPERGGIDYRHQINETWMALRRLSQNYHVLLVTATQSDADSYDREILRKGNFSEDKRKLSHVTGMVGLNQTEAEKERGIFRLNWILLREGAYYESKCVTVAGNLALAHPTIVSIW